MTNLIIDQQRLARWVKASNEHLDIAVAFWGAGAVEELGLSENRSFRILLDLTSGGSNPFEVRRLRDIDPSRVRCVDRLHAKAFISPTQALVGSANASANGLGIEGAEAMHWKELGLMTSAQTAVAEAQAWFEMLWATSQEITEASLALAESAWRRRRAHRPVKIPGDILQIADSNPEVVADRRIFVHVVTQTMTRGEEKALAKLEKEAGTPLHAYADWPDIPIDATLITFLEYEGEPLSLDDPFITRTPSKKKRSKFKFVTESDLGEFVASPAREWLRRVRRLKKDHPRYWNANNGFVLDIVKFAELTAIRENKRP